MQERCRAAVAELGHDLARVLERGVLDEQREPTPGLDGYAGMALFFALAARSELATPGDHERARQCLEIACRHAGTLPPTLFGGFVGVAWTACVLRELAVTGGEPLMRHVDDMLVQLIAWQASEGVTWEFDLVNGLVGLGVYAVERSAARAGEDSCRSVAGILELLEQRAYRAHGGLAWCRPASAAAGGRTDLGVAHGCAGILGLALAAVDVPGAQARAARLGGHAMRFLLAIADQHAGEPFPPVVAPSDGRPLLAPPGTPSPLSWCNGAPGITAILERAADRLGGARERERARALARQAAATSTTRRTHMRAPGLCHGAFGLAHLFARAFHATSDRVFQDAAIHWTGVGLDVREPGAGIAGWRASGADGVVRTEPGYRLGASGIGLALLALATHSTPWWDRLSLLSSHAREPS